MDARLDYSKPIGDRFREPTASENALSFSELVDKVRGFVRRQFPIFAFTIACTIALGSVYLLTTPPSYTAHAMLVIDSSKLRVLRQQDASLADAPIDNSQVETQVEILKSENIGASVIKDLKLDEDPEFAASGGGLVGSLRGLIMGSEAPSQTELEQQVLSRFLAKRTITRVARTYALDIAYTSLNPARAASVANAIADAYIVDQLESKYQATKRASVWLQDRIRELRQQVSDADRAVLDYKEQNKIVSVGASPSGGARLLSEQQLEELNTQLGAARAAAEETKARLQRIDDVMQKDVPDATVADSLRSDVINRLRNNYLDLASREAIWSARYGPAHLAAVNLRTQMAELRRAIHDELGRIAQGYKSDYEIAKSRIDGLERRLSSLVSESQAINRDRLGLRDLESKAQVYHTLYDNFLQRYMEAVQQQSFPITESRVISPAKPPKHKSGPVTSVVLGITFFMGLVLSFGAALLREAIDSVFRSAREIESNLHARCLAVLPRLGMPETAKQGLLRRAGLTTPSAGRTRHQLQVPEGAASKRRPADGELSPSRPFMRQVIDEPLSGFAEAFRSIKVAADIGGQQVIGITSTVPAEGKSTVSSNLAELIAHTGKRVILLDGDLRNPTLTRALASGAKAGLLEVLNGEIELEQAICVDQGTGMRFLPTVVRPDLAHTNEILASDRFKNFVDKLREDHDYVLIDLSPVAPVVDVRATTAIIDSYVYVIEWGRTHIKLVQHELSNFPELRDRLLGFVLNKADVRVLERYEPYYGRYHYRNYGGQYPQMARGS
jgi:exopolysaccharide transport family protein